MSQYVSFDVINLFLSFLFPGQNSIYRHEEKEAGMTPTNRALYNILLDPYEKKNLYLVETEVQEKLLTRLKYHCRQRQTYVPLVEREESNPKLYNNIFTPWLKDWEEVEWQPTKLDLEHFEQFYFNV